MRLRLTSIFERMLSKDEVESLQAQVTEKREAAMFLESKERELRDTIEDLEEQARIAGEKAMEANDKAEAAEKQLAEIQDIRAKRVKVIRELVKKYGCE